MKRIKNKLKRMVRDLLDLGCIWNESGYYLFNLIPLWGVRKSIDGRVVKYYLLVFPVLKIRVY